MCWGASATCAPALAAHAMTTAFVANDGEWWGEDRDGALSSTHGQRQRLPQSYPRGIPRRAGARRVAVRLQRGQVRRRRRIATTRPPPARGRVRERRRGGTPAALGRRQRKRQGRAGA